MSRTFGREVSWQESANNVDTQSCIFESKQIQLIATGYKLVQKLVSKCTWVQNSSDVVKWHCIFLAKGGPPYFYRKCNIFLFFCLLMAGGMALSRTDFMKMHGKRKQPEKRLAWAQRGVIQVAQRRLNYLLVSGGPTWHYYMAVVPSRRWRRVRLATMGVT